MCLISFIFISDKMVQLLIFSMCLVLTMMWFLGWKPKKKEASNEANDRRTLGNYEQVYLNLGRKGGLSIVKTAIFASLKPIYLENVEKALCRLAKRHPLLRMKIKQSICNKTTNDWFVPIDKMNIKLEELPDKIWLDVMEKQLSDPIINREEGPLWHVKFLPNINTEDTHIKLPHQCALIFVFDHAMSDGGALMHLINETLLFLEDDLNDVDISDNIDSLPLPKSVCDITDIENKLPFSFKCIKLLIRWFPCILGMIVKQQRSKNCVIKNMAKSSLKRNKVSATHMIPTTFNEKDTKAIMKACKSHYVSPLAAIQAAMITILTEKQYISGEIEFTATVDLRRYYPECKANDKYQQVANYVTLVPCKITIPEEKINNDFWSLAESCKHAVHDKLLTRIRYNLQLFLIMSKFPFQHPSQISQITFTNFGNCSFLNRQDGCPIRLLAFYGGTSMHDELLPLYSISYLENRLIWNLNFSTGNISRDLATQIVGGINKKLLEIA